MSHLIETRPCVNVSQILVLFLSLSDREHVVQSSPSVSGYQSLHSYQLHHPDRHGGLTITKYHYMAVLLFSHLPQRISFVGVEPSLHYEDWNTVEKSQQKSPHMTYRTRYKIFPLQFTLTKPSTVERGKPGISS